MHAMLSATLGSSHLCDDSVHDWCHFLRECTNDVPYNKRDLPRIVISLIYTGNSEFLGGKLIDMMEEAIPNVHKGRRLLSLSIF